MITVLRSLLFNLLFFFWGVTYFTLCLPVLLVSSRATFLVARIWVRGVLWLLAVICNLRYQVRGQENLPDGPALIASKHQSAWETLIFAALIDHPCVVMKRELTWIPLFGWYCLRSGIIAINRSAGSSALRKMLKQAKRTIAEGRSIVVFPEGTRVPLGQQRPYQPGISALYKSLSVPVVPVALNSGRFWGRRTFLKRPGCITLEFLPVIEPGLSRQDFEEILKGRIDEASNRLLA